MLKLTVGALMLAPMIALAVDDAPPKADQRELDGTWVLVDGYTAGGEQVDLERYKQIDSRMVISGDEIVHTPAIWSASFKITTDPSRSPKTIDRTHKEGRLSIRPPSLGIYRVKGDILEMSFAGQGSERPTELAPCPKGSDKRWAFARYRRLGEEKRNH